MYSRNSRYVDSDLITENDVKFFSIWTRIKEIKTSTESINFLEHTIQQSEVGCLDILADRYYNNQRLWWYIAAFNNIINPIEDMFVGQTLKIPSLTYLQTFLARSQHG